MQQVGLPAPFGGGDWNGALAGPTLADLDGDADLEVVLNTAHSGFVAYDLPGTAGAASYRAYRSTSAQMSGATRIGETAALSLTDPGAQQDGVRAVYYQVRGVNGCGVE